MRLKRYYANQAEFLKTIVNVRDSNGCKIGNWCKKGRDDLSVYCTFCKSFIKTKRKDSYSKTLVFVHASTWRHKAVGEIKRRSKNCVENAVKHCSTNLKHKSFINNFNSKAEDLSLNAHHSKVLGSYLQFAKCRREEHLQTVEKTFEAAKVLRFTKGTFSADEVRGMLDELFDSLKSDLEAELINTAHAATLLLCQMSRQAQQAHLKLNADVSELENSDMLEKVNKFEEKLTNNSANLDSPLQVRELQPHSESSGSCKLLQTPLSEYEKKMKEKKMKNREIFESLGINEAKEQLNEAVSTIKQTEKKRIIYERPDPVFRSSKRSKEDAHYVDSEDCTSVDVMKQISNPTVKSFRKTVKPNTSFQYEKFVKDFNEIITAKKKKKPKPILYDKDILRNLEPKIISLEVNKVSAMSWFPSNENLVLAVGDASGSLKFKNIKESGMEFHVFSPHSRKISHLQYSPFNSFHLISSSLDGKVLCCDMQAQIFSQVLNTDNGSFCTCFDFISPFSYIVSLSNGHIIITDSREQKENNVPVSTPKSIPLHNSAIRSLHVHPVNKNLFVTATEKEKQICIWDLRKLVCPLVKSTSHSANVFRATFSPVSGKYIMSATMNEICIYDSTNMFGRSMECLNSMDISKNPDVSEFYRRPVWLPNSDDFFAYTCKDFPSIHIFDINFNIYEKLSKDHIKICKSIPTFHPFQSALACTLTSNKIVAYEKSF